MEQSITNLDVEWWLEANMHMYTVGQKTDNFYALVGNQLDLFC